MRSPPTLRLASDYQFVGKTLLIVLQTDAVRGLQHCNKNPFCHYQTPLVQKVILDPKGHAYCLCFPGHKHGTGTWSSTLRHTSDPITRNKRFYRQEYEFDSGLVQHLYSNA